MGINQDSWPPAEVKRRLGEDTPATEGHFFGHGRFIFCFAAGVKESGMTSTKQLPSGWGMVPSEPDWDLPPHAILNSLLEVIPDHGCVLRRNDALMAYGSNVFFPCQDIEETQKRNISLRSTTSLTGVMAHPSRRRIRMFAIFWVQYHMRR